MKTILLFLLILYIPFEIIYSQINKKTIVTGGSINLSLQKLENGDDFDKNYSVDFRPVIGYFFVKNLSVSIVPIFTYSFRKQPYNNYLYDISLEDESIGFGAAPEITYYLLDKRFHPFFTFETAFLFEKFSSDLGYEPPVLYTITGDRMIRRISPGTGILYMLNEHIGLTMCLKYSWIHTAIKYTEYDGDDFKYDTDNTSLNLFFGIKVFIFSKQPLK